MILQHIPQSPQVLAVPDAGGSVVGMGKARIRLQRSPIPKIVCKTGPVAERRHIGLSARSPESVARTRSGATQRPDVAQTPFPMPPTRA